MKQESKSPLDNMITIEETIVPTSDYVAHDYTEDLRSPIDSFLLTIDTLRPDFGLQAWI